MKNTLILVTLAIMTTLLVGCSDKPTKPEPLELHEDETRLVQLNPYVGIVVVLRGPLYLVAIASIIASVGFLLRADAYHTKITKTVTKEETHA